jgi:hypothetical protein
MTVEKFDKNAVQAFHLMNLLLISFFPEHLKTYSLFVYSAPNTIDNFYKPLESTRIFLFIPFEETELSMYFKTRSNRKPAHISTQKTTLCKI